MSFSMLDWVTRRTKNKWSIATLMITRIAEVVVVLSPVQVTFSISIMIIMSFIPE